MKVDILMATFNGEKYLKEQIDSILNQTYSNFSLHISDDKSSDSTREILKQYANKDNRIVLYFQEENLGYIKNFEFLIRNSTADYVMLSDQDDVWMNNKVEFSIEKMLDGQFDLVITDLEIVNHNLKKIESSYFKKINFKIKDNVSIANYLLRNPAAGCTMMFNRKIIQHLLPFPNLKSPYYVHDWYIYLIGQAYGKVGHLTIPLIKYRQHGNNNIGMHRNKKRKFDFIQTARDINLTYRIEFCDELLKVIKNKKRLEIEKFRNYLLYLKKSKIINFKINEYMNYSKTIGIKAKLRYLFVFHFPFILLSKKSDDK